MFGKKKPAQTIDQPGHPATYPTRAVVQRADNPPAQPGLSREQMAAIAQLSKSDRLKALISALQRAQRAASAGPYFDVERGIRALEKGSMRLTGSRAQIEAQLLVHRVAVVVMKRLFRPPAARHTDALEVDADELL